MMGDETWLHSFEPGTKSLWDGMQIPLGETGSVLYTASKVMGTVFRDAPSVIQVYVNTMKNFLEHFYHV
jgi:hypothetical protein